mmetsp:Transcript_10938/g.9663  ORF Transcript_10938/g.9663 Transcript_10938/m.9663 type:complete len:89 (+) Transcript_10938:292-558(+)
MMISHEIDIAIGGLQHVIQSVYIEEKYRKYGICRKLYSRAIELAKADKDCKCVRLFVGHENKIAQIVYKKFGMEHWGYAVNEKEYLDR